MPSVPLYRKAHWLRKNHGNMTPGLLLAVHVQTRAFEPDAYPGCRVEQLAFGTAICSRLDKGTDTNTHECDFASPEAFWRFVDGFLGRRRTLWIVMHDAVRTMELLRGHEKIETGELDLGDVLE